MQMKSQYGRTVMIDGLTDASVQKHGNRMTGIQHQRAKEIWFIGMTFENADAFSQILIQGRGFSMEDSTRNFLRGGIAHRSKIRSRSVERGQRRKTF
jgi:hypothetical protein